VTVLFDLGVKGAAEAAASETAGAVYLIKEVGKRSLIVMDKKHPSFPAKTFTNQLQFPFSMIVSGPSFAGQQQQQQQQRSRQLISIITNEVNRFSLTLCVYRKN